jgi:hypothetical protein
MSSDVGVLLAGIALLAILVILVSIFIDHLAEIIRQETRR